VYSAKVGIFNNILLVYGGNLNFTKSKAYSKAANPYSRQRGCYIRTITARVQLEKISLFTGFKGPGAKAN
jgi:hypothetical protein